MAGTLYIVATPIGNLEDITLRALRVLAEVQAIACEDTRTTQKLLSHFSISKPLFSYHEHNELSRTGQIMRALDEGDSIALVSDAGTPLVSDPGYRLVAAAIESGHSVVPIPGVSAFITALVGSGLLAEQFRFLGFLPSRELARNQSLKEMATNPSPTVFYESPRRILQTLRQMDLVLGDRRVALARELTKLHEEFIRGTALSIRKELEIRPIIRGEVTVVIGKSEVPLSAAEGDPVHEVDRLERELGLGRMEAIKAVARSRGLSKGELYKIVVRQLGGVDRNSV